MLCADTVSVDGLVKCEKWINDGDDKEESKTAWWLNRLIGRTKKVFIDWPYPFVEEKLFVLTLSAGLEGYHVNVDGRHVTSFPYRTVSLCCNSPTTDRFGFNVVLEIILWFKLLFVEFCS